MGEHSRRPDRSPRVPNWLYHGVVVVVVILYGTGIILSWLGIAQMPESLNTIAPVVIVAVLGGKAVSDSRRSQDGDDDE